MRVLDVNVKSIWVSLLQGVLRSEESEYLLFWDRSMLRV